MARRGCAITVATNDEARELNARIRDERVRAGEVDDGCTATGSDGLSIGRGDVIQTRQNDSGGARGEPAGVGRPERGRRWRGVGEGTHRRVVEQRTVRLPAEYVAEHTHLAYASTAYGMQGATVPESHTMLGDAMDASAVYVGMTRARNSNRVHLVAADRMTRGSSSSLALERDRADRGLARATAAARESVRGLSTATASIGTPDEVRRR